MGLLFDLTSRTPTGSDADVHPLRDVLSIMGGVDGRLDDLERRLIGALAATVPQLRTLGDLERPPQLSRKKLLEDLAKLEDERLRRQCFVLAVEVALASGGANESEDQYLEHLRGALRVDEAFARQVIEVMAYKYARAVR